MSLTPVYAMENTIPGVVQGGDTTSQGSSISVLDGATTKDVVNEFLERVQAGKVFIRSDPKDSTEDITRIRVQNPEETETVIISFCLRCFMQCHARIGQISNCMKPFIYIVGVGTIIADTMIYLGGSNSELAGYAAVFVIAFFLVSTAIYKSFAYYYRHELRQ